MIISLSDCYCDVLGIILFPSVLALNDLTENADCVLPIENQVLTSI